MSFNDQLHEPNRHDYHHPTFARFFAALIMTLAMGCASTDNQDSTGAYINDTVLTTKVKAAIFNEPTLSSAEINVETFKGSCN